MLNFNWSKQDKDVPMETLFKGQFDTPLLLLTKAVTLVGRSNRALDF